MERPGIIVAIGVASILFGVAGFLWHAQWQVLTLLGPMAPPDMPPPVGAWNLVTPTIITFYLSLAVSVWLIVAGIRVFTWSGSARFGFKGMLSIFIAAQLCIGVARTLCVIAANLNMSVSIPARDWIGDALRCLLITTIYPFLLIAALRSRKVRAYCDDMSQVS